VLNTLQRCKPLLGTFVDVVVSDNVSDKALIDLSNQLFNQIEMIHLAMSFHDPKSELSIINQYASEYPVELSIDMHIIFQHALALSELTQGDYDLSIGTELVTRQVLPDHKVHAKEGGSWQDIVVHDDSVFFNTPLLIDMGGIAKGYAVDKAIESVTTDADITINAGGDLRMTHWQNKQVAIRVPYSKSGESITTEMRSAALATSGYYINKHQYVNRNAATQQKIAEHSVSVFSDSCMIADSLTKVALLHTNAENIIQKYNSTLFVLDRDGIHVNTTD
jgi:thiamine biosynthesis lipoprotein